MAAIGLVLGITAKTGKFKKDMRGASKSVERFGNKTRSVIRTIAKLSTVIGGLAGLAGVGAFTLLIRNSLKSIDALAKMAARMDVTTESLTAFGLAAQINGASVEAMQRGIQDMTRRLGEAVDGSGEATEGLKLLGLSAKKLIGLRQDEAFKEIAEAISKTSNVALKAAASYAIFGRKGRELLNTLNLGRAGLEAFEVEAEKLGITFSVIDASKIEAANDAITRMKARFQGLIQQITIKLAPFIEALVTKMSTFGLFGGSAADTVRKAFNFLVKIVAKLGTLFDKLRVKIQELKVFALRSLQKVINLFLANQGVFKALGFDIGKVEGFQLTVLADVLTARLKLADLRKDVGSTGKAILDFVASVEAAADKAARARTRLFGGAGAGAAAGLPSGATGPGGVSNVAFAPRFAAGFGGPLQAESPVQIMKRLLADQQKATLLIERMAAVIVRLPAMASIGRF